MTKKKPRVSLPILIVLVLILTILVLAIFIEVEKKDYSKLSNDTPVSDLQDGTYQVYSAYYDPFGYGLVLTMKVKDHIITSIHVNEYNQKGEERIISAQSDISWDDGNENLSQILYTFYNTVIHKQTDEVDAVSGATVTSDSMNVLLSKAFEIAKTGQNSASTDDFTWTYTVRNEPNAQNDSQEELSVTYEDGEIISVSCEEVKNTTSLYLTSRIYAQFAEISTANQSLSPISSEVNTEEVERYNALLEKVASYRQSFRGK